MQEIKSISQFNKLKQSPLLIIDFYATWCGPCKVISPVFDKLAKQYEGSTAVVFANSDVDKAQDVAQACGITAMPTFQFFKNGKKVDEVRGADPGQLTTKIGYHAAAAVKENAGSKASDEDSKPAASGPISLRSLIDIKASKLLNTNNLSTIQNIVSPPPAGYAVASAPGAQLLIHLAFSQAATPSNLKVTIDKNGMSNAPSRIHVGANVPVNETTPLTMDSLSKTENTQSFNVYSDEYSNGTADLKLKHSKFTGVKSLTIRVDANMSGEGSTMTKIKDLDIIGQKA